ncbi:uncharacterized protein NPIL_370701 [Nephila pilipes]|uniref:DZANK-type domain-containing protein n=1 Tax=Nephila pilipes TaxID=299642 RepID=A0A8X6PT47_NEPPI|nr:uncharacterized protein NPIL_370701 [Nephila pilipes]
MAPFSIPAPCIVPLRTPVFGGSRTIDTQTKVELMCETYLAHEIFYTLDGTKPQPYAGIVQGSKLYKYKCPFCLPAGKITVKAIALNTYVRSMRSNVVTKYFEVIKIETDSITKKESNKGVKKGSSNASKKNRKPEPTPAQEVSTPASNEVAEKVDFEFHEDVKENHERRDSLGSIDEFPPDLDYFPGEDSSDGLSDAGSLNSVPERKEVTEYKTEENMFAAQNSPPTEKEQDSQENGESLSVDEHKNKSLSEDDENLQVEKKTSLDELSSKAATYCIMCETVLQHCRLCTTLNAITSKYCIHCGEKLMHRCSNCMEFISMMASFCQFCGKKVELDDESLISYADHSMMAEPQKMNVSVQQSLNTANKETQTPVQSQKDYKDFISPRKKKLPSHSPGRGYWHQQLDYICNHLKSYAFNNVEFRESISKPMLSEFQKVEVIKDDDSITVTISFTPFVLEKENDVKYLNQKSFV